MQTNRVFHGFSYESRRRPIASIRQRAGRRKDLVGFAHDACLLWSRGHSFARGAACQGPPVTLESRAHAAGSTRELGSPLVIRAKAVTRLGGVVDHVVIPAKAGTWRLGFASHFVIPAKAGARRLGAGANFVIPAKAGTQ